MEYETLILPVKGAVRDAIYIEQSIPNYSGNPLIEALPPILNTKQAMKKLAHYPDYNELRRQLPSEVRYQMLEDIVRFFTPLNIHIDLERRISRVIRTGLIERNPMKTVFWQNNRQQSRKVNPNSISQYGDDDDLHTTSAYGFNVIGVSGGGKSLSIERILRLLPQLIRHKRYKNRNFIFSQIVWLKLDCPFDGGIKGLCINFFQTVDSILGTSYHKNYGSRSRNTDEMLPYMALVAANHGIGVLVIDEIQRLSLAKSGGIEKMLNFFVQIVNTVGVPVILVGTYKSLSIFDGNFSQMRRGTGQGDMVWDRMKFGREWSLFVKALWHFQYTRKICYLEDSPELIEVLYEESQGITDLAVKAYMLAQERAIETGKELITTAVIRSACRDRFRIIRPALDALKSKTKNALTRFEDAYPKFLETYIENASVSSAQQPQPIPPQIYGEIASAPEVRSLTKKSAKATNATAKDFADSKNAVSDSTQSSLENLELWLEKTGKSKNTSQQVKPAVLPKVLDSIRVPSKITVHAALDERGYIRSSDEFIKGGKES